MKTALFAEAELSFLVGEPGAVEDDEARTLTLRHEATA